MLQHAETAPKTRHNPASRANALSSLIGRTPLLELDVSYKGRRHRIFAKAEQYNLTGSIKDRVALWILSMAMETGDLAPGDTISEATSGNSGIAFSAVGRALGCNVRIFMPDWLSDERKNLLRSLGADLHLVSRDEGGFLGAIEQSDKFVASHLDAFCPGQFTNEQNCLSHQVTTGAEIVDQLKRLKVTPDAFVSGIGTGGTIMGVGRALRGYNPVTQVVAMEPAESPTLSTGYKVGSHRIEGISDDFIPDIVNMDEIDEILPVHDGDAIILAQRLARELGLGVGISSGGNLAAALMLADRMPEGSSIVTIFCDDNKKYLSTDLAKTEPVQPGYVSPDVELHGFSSVRCK